MNTKRKGGTNERKSKKLLEVAGWYCAKSGASLGEWDLVCCNKLGVLLVQVKSGGRLPSPEERERLELFDNCPPNTEKYIHIWEDFKRNPRIIKI